jgi:osmotically-inducible protein OsmY
LNSGGTAGNPGGSSFGQAQPSTSDDTSPGNSAFGQQRGDERRSDQAQGVNGSAVDTAVNGGSIGAATSSVNGTATQSTDTTSSAIRSGTTDNGLSATGTSSSTMTPAASSTIITASQTVRQALDANPAFSTFDVRVVPQGQTLILRGSVSDATVRTSIEQAAQKAAGDVKIENQITLQK